MRQQCSATRVSLSALLDGELEARRQSAVEAHLAICADCRAEYGALRGLAAVLPCWTAPEAPSRAAFDARLAMHRARRPWYTGVWARAAMALGVVAVVTALVIPHPGPRPVPTVTRNALPMIHAPIPRTVTSLPDEPVYSPPIRPFMPAAVTGHRPVIIETATRSTPRTRRPVVQPVPARGITPALPVPDATATVSTLLAETPPVETAPTVALDATPAPEREPEALVLALWSEIE